MEATNVEKIYVHHENEDKDKYAKKSVANTALGLSIGGLAWMLLSGRGLPGLNGIANPAVVAAETGCNPCGPTAWQAWQKSCNDELALTNAMWTGREKINQEMFGLYKSQIDADFMLYKGQRDNFDTLYNKIAALETQVAVSNAIRPYQDKIINLSIDDARKDAKYDLSHAMCRVIKGEVVLPNTPVVSGFGSYSFPYCGNASTQAAA